MNKLESFTKDSTYACIDFDGTITVWTIGKRWRPMSSISFLVTQKSVHPEFDTHGHELYKKYRPIETSTTIDIEEKNKQMLEWWKEVFQLFQRFSVWKQVFDEAIENIGELQIRGWMKDFLQEFSKKWIPVIIFSAGIKLIIEKFLEHHWLLTPNISVIANEFSFDGFWNTVIPEEQDIICAANKDSRHFSQEILSIINWRENIIVIWDNPHDVDMASHISWKHNIFSLGFLNYPNDELRRHFSEVFDFVIESHDTSWWALVDIIWKIK
jgi:HAD superfamily hydrolase (TIGR01544 family)